jgi:hypothetical protein
MYQEYALLLVWAKQCALQAHQSNGYWLYLKPTIVSACVLSFVRTDVESCQYPSSLPKIPLAIFVVTTTSINFIKV